MATPEETLHTHNFNGNSRQLAGIKWPELCIGCAKPATSDMDHRRLSRPGRMKKVYETVNTRRTKTYSYTYPVHTWVCKPCLERGLTQSKAAHAKEKKTVPITLGVVGGVFLALALYLIYFRFDQAWWSYLCLIFPIAMGIGALAVGISKYERPNPHDYWYSTSEERLLTTDPLDFSPSHFFTFRTTAFADAFRKMNG